ncbi:MAG: helix-turn-helix domain-containing protein [Gammaproteobacteria bacterium]|nr:helix-turn-helix domain-containing protein [Gammaproteobacteria bacterium]
MSDVKRVVILAADNSVLSSIASPMDMFLQAGVLWNVAMGARPNPLFDVEIVTADGNPVTAVNNFPVVPKRAMSEVDTADLVIVPSQGFFFDPSTSDHHQRIEWLKGIHERGSDLASVCAGAFTLASTGLLDGKTATTHWSMAKQFRKQFPEVDLRTDLLVTDEEHLFCGGGISAELNLSLYLIEKYCGREIALQSARCTLVDLDCITQSPFAVFTPEKNHSDKLVLDAQEHVEKSYHGNVDVEAIAADAGMSVRQFNRRFKSATGETFNGYLQLVRIEAAKADLVNTGLPFEEISLKAGYENVSFFRRIFKKSTSITPAEYRRRFGNH